MRVQIIRKKPISRNTGEMDCQIIRADFSADYVPLHKQRIDLSNAENPLGSSGIIAAAIKDSLGQIAHYPERDHGNLIGALSQHHGLPLESFFIGNGATGCIQNIVMTFVGNGGHVLLPELSFPLPIFAATVMGGGARKVPMTEDFRINFDVLLQSINKHTRLVFLCNPNNPTGIYEEPEDILEFAKKVRVPVLVSEANIEYAGTSLLEAFAMWPDNLIVVRSFSKVHGLAGLRVGYGIAAPKMVHEIMKFQLPFGVSHLSQAAAIAALRDVEHVRRSVLTMRGENKFLCKQLEVLGFEVLSTDSNIFLAKLPDHVPDDLVFVASLERQGITVLSGTAFSSSLRGWIRVSPRTRQINTSFIAGIKRALNCL